MGSGGTRFARVVVEADGGSRGNPGPAAYGSVLRDADTGEVIAQRAEVIGVASNNVAEYRGLIGGLELVAEHAPGAEVEVRMDSKLVIEQMAGRWKVKHPAMKPLALRAQRLAPPGVRWTWVPRERNKAADAILNDALDDAQGKRPRLRTASGGEPPDSPASAGGHVAARAQTPAGGHVSAARDPFEMQKRDFQPGSDRGTGSTGADEAEEEPADPTALAAGERVDTNPLIGWRGHTDGTPTTVLLLRHGATAHTLAKLFCGSGGLDPGLLEAGQEQAERAAAWLARHGGVDAVVTSPLRRTRETAQVVADHLGLEVAVEDDLTEAAFGRWDGLSFEQVHERFPDELGAWLHDTSVAPPGGESFDSVSQRAVRARDRLLEQYAGRTLVAVSHVTPIKMLVRAALDAPMHVIYRMELAPASLTTIQWWPDGTPSLCAFSYVPD